MPWPLAGDVWEGGCTKAPEVGKVVRSTLLRLSWAGALWAEIPGLEITSVSEIKFQCF